MRLLTKTGITSASLLSILSSASAVTITVDYTYDTNNFFDTAAKQAAMQRAADRWSSVLADGQLGTAEINDSNDGRIAFFHPGTGQQNFQISGASSASSDSLSSAGAGDADVYQSINFASDTWLLYAGGRDLGTSMCSFGGLVLVVSILTIEKPTAFPMGSKRGERTARLARHAHRF